ncbi:mitochondrial transcription rescue factor 1 isoform X1 [Eurosta solidaginis]|uniref:mitochondrial transcription rescue factor 1 isoform X1 n=1 Tax=Eurosta solidaginis TaxID=178769 RepID=UPI003530752C
MLKFWNNARLNRLLSIAQAKVAKQSLSGYCKKYDFVPETNHLSQATRLLHTGRVLAKYNKQSNQDDEDETDDVGNVKEFADERDSKVVKANVHSLRADLLIKAGLGMARNKVETIFYESKVRVNGKKLNKKSVQLNVGDEIDVIRGFSHSNPSHLVVSRVIVLDFSNREEGYSVQLRRYKSLLIENYSGTNAYKSSDTVQH